MSEKQIEAIVYLCILLISAPILIGYAKLYKYVARIRGKIFGILYRLDPLYFGFYFQVYIYPLFVFYAVEIFRFEIEKYFLYIFLTTLILTILSFKKIGSLFVRLAGFKEVINEDGNIVKVKKKYISIQSFFLTFYTIALLVNFTIVVMRIFI